MGWPYERPDIHVSTTLTRRDQAYRAAQRHFIFLPAGPKLVTRTNMVILYPAYRNWERGIINVPIICPGPEMTPNPTASIILPCFRNSKMFSPDWHRCLDTRWVGLCSSLSQGKFLCCSRLPQTRVDCVTHVTHWDTIARQANSSENENLSTLSYLLFSTWSEEIWIGQHVIFT